MYFSAQRTNHTVGTQYVILYSYKIQYEENVVRIILNKLQLTVLEKTQTVVERNCYLYTYLYVSYI